MNKQLSDQMCELVFKSSENEKRCMDKMLCLETNNICINEKSVNLLSCSFETLSFSDHASYSQDCSSCSSFTYSDNAENEVLTYNVPREMRSTREKLTFEWVKTLCEVSKYDLDSSFDCINNSSNNMLRKDYSPDNHQSNLMEAYSAINIDDEVIFMEDSKDSDLSDLTFCLEDAFTEENFDSGFSLITKGSLSNYIDDDFLEDGDFELVFSTSPLSASNLPGWSDIISESSELSQSYENEVFVDLFELPAKSKALKKVNERWNSDMCDVNEEPRNPVKVTFAPNLVTVHRFQKSLEENQPYDASALDKMRFKKRIEELGKLLAPILTLEHRTNIILRNSLSIGDD